MAEPTPKRRRSGGRAGGALRRGSAAIEQMPWRLPVNPDRPTEPLNTEGVAAILTWAMQLENAKDTGEKSEDLCMRTVQYNRQGGAWIP